MKFHHLIVLFSMAIGLAACEGSGDSSGAIDFVETEGVVTFDGEPLQGASIAFSELQPGAVVKSGPFPLAQIEEGLQTDGQGRVSFKVPLSMRDDKLYLLTVSCPDTGQCKLQSGGSPPRELHVVLNRGHVSGGWGASEITELAYLKLLYYVAADFTASEMLGYLNTLAKFMFKDGLVVNENQGYGQLFRAESEDLSSEATELMTQLKEGLRAQKLDQAALITVVADLAGKFRRPLIGRHYTALDKDKDSGGKNIQPSDGGVSYSHLRILDNGQLLARRMTSHRFSLHDPASIEPYPLDNGVCTDYEATGTRLNEKLGLPQVLEWSASEKYLDVDPVILEVSGSSAYAGHASRLQMFDISDICNPVEKFTIEIGAGNVIQSAAVAGSYLVILQSDRQLKIHHAQNGEEIWSLNDIEGLPSEAVSQARYIAAKVNDDGQGLTLFVLVEQSEDGLALCANEKPFLCQARVYAYQLSEGVEASGQPLTTMPLKGAWGYKRLIVQGNRLYTGTDESDPNIVAFDIADPRSPKVAGAIGTFVQFFDYVLGRNGVLHIARKDSADTQIVDSKEAYAIIENLNATLFQSPVTVVGSTSTIIPERGGLEDAVLVPGASALVVSANDVAAYDVSVPSQLSLTALGDRARGLRGRLSASSGSRVAAISESQLSLLELKNSGFDRTDIGDLGVGGLREAFLDGDDMFVTYGTLDQSTPPLVDSSGVKRIRGPAGASSDFVDSGMQNQLALAVTADERFVYVISKPDDSCRYERTAGNIVENCIEADLKAQGDKVSDGRSLLAVYGRGDGSFKGEILVPAGGQFIDVSNSLVSSGGYLYVTTWDGLRVYRIDQEKGTPTLTTSDQDGQLFSTSGGNTKGLFIYNLHLVNGFLYFSVAEKGLFVADITGDSAGSPRVVGQYDDYGLFSKFTVGNAYAYGVGDTFWDVMVFRAVQRRD